MKILLILLTCLAGVAAAADCKHELPVQGVLSLSGCDPKTQTCVPAHQAISEYQKRLADNDKVLFVWAHSSPWRLYDGDFRILPIEAIAERAKPMFAKGVTRIVLQSSWSGVPPAPGAQSLAQRLSAALGGIPVEGMAGFLWIATDGKLRTTRQSATMKVGGGYHVARGEEVMVSAVFSPMLAPPSDPDAGRAAQFTMLAGVAWDVYGLCPERALAAFEHAARLGNAIGAYNGALMLLDRGTSADRKLAGALLAQASNSGDLKARQLLQKLGSAGR